MAGVSNPASCDFSQKPTGARGDPHHSCGSVCFFWKQVSVPKNYMDSINLTSFRVKLGSPKPLEKEERCRPRTINTISKPNIVLAI